VSFVNIMAGNSGWGKLTERSHVEDTDGDGVIILK